MGQVREMMKETVYREDHGIVEIYGEQDRRLFVSRTGENLLLDSFEDSSLEGRFIAMNLNKESARQLREVIDSFLGDTV